MFFVFIERIKMVEEVLLKDGSRIESEIGPVVDFVQWKEKEEFVGLTKEVCLFF